MPMRLSNRLLRRAMHAEHVKGRAFVRATGLPPRAQAILNRIPADQPFHAVEVGVFRGALSHVLLQERPKLHLTMVDLWGPNYSPDFKTTNVHSVQDKFPIGRWPMIFQIAMQKVAFAWNRVRPIRADSVAAADGIQDGSLDGAFIDDDHSLSGCTRSIVAYYPKVKRGGWIGGHDYDHPDKRFKFRVTEAVHAFFDPLGLPIELDLDCTWFVRIPA